MTKSCALCAENKQEQNIINNNNFGKSPIEINVLILILPNSETVKVLGMSSQSKGLIDDDDRNPFEVLL